MFLDATMLLSLVGVFAIAASVWPSTTFRQALLIGGIVTLAGARHIAAPQDNQPTPPPAPLVTTFGQQAAAAFTGTKAEAQQMSAMFRAFARIVQWDGTRQPPRIKSTDDFRKLWQEMQRATVLSDSTQWGSQYKALVDVISARLAQDGLPHDAIVDFGPILRGKLVTTFNELADALAKAGK
jgi:hypothetical protein